MKKTYFEPDIEIQKFSFEEILAGNLPESAGEPEEQIGTEGGDAGEGDI